MLGVGKPSHRSLDVLPTTLVVERPPNRRRDERAALTLTDAAIEGTHNLVVQAYV
jgi:hypothetical protein